LLVKNIDVTYYGTDFFCSTASEFSKLARFSNSFENKLLEHGKVIIKKNAISTAVKYFAY
jgi:negative regulator of genetic competence, sporulation and motility